MSEHVPASPRSPSRAVFRRRRAIVIGLGGTLLLAFLYVAGSLLTPVPATAAVVTNETSLVRPAAQLVWPEHGHAAITAPGYAGATEYHGGEESVPIASLTKVVTALVVLDVKPLIGDEQGPRIDFTQEDVEIWHQVMAEGGSWAPVQAGTSMTEKEALTAMLLPSANNYAISLVNWAYGSQADYVVAANTWLAAEGFTDTRVVSADGLDPGNVSSTTDLLGIGALALDSPVLSSIVSQTTATLPGAGEQSNTNVLLGWEGVDGLKTGNTDEAGNCLLFSANLAVGSSTVRVLGVVLGAPTHDAVRAHVQALLTSMKTGFHEVPASVPGQVFGVYSTPWNANSDVVATTATRFVVWSDTPIEVSLEIRPLQSGTAGDRVGRVTFTSNGTTKSAELALTEDIPEPGLGWRLAHPAGIGI